MNSSIKTPKKPRVIAVPAFKDNYIWLYPDSEAENTVIVVDPGEAEPVLSFCETNKLIPSAILITHLHHDHIGGVAKLVQIFDIPIYGPQPSIRQVYPQAHPLSDKENIRIGNVAFDILTVPGHTLDHIAYYRPGSLLCGDTLFSSGCGYLFEGTAEQMSHSLSRISTLPDDTLCYCTHEYTLANLAFAKAVEPDNLAIDARIIDCQQKRKANKPTVPTTLALEKQVNPFLRCQRPTVIQAAEHYANAALANKDDVFRILRQWKDRF